MPPVARAQHMDSYENIHHFLLWQPLKKALRMMGAPNLIADTMDCGLSYSVISYLKKLSQQVNTHVLLISLEVVSLA